MAEPTYFIVKNWRLTESEAGKIKTALKENGVANPIILHGDIKVIKPRPRLLAICKYCFAANLNSGAECLKCGASLAEVE